MPINKNKKDNVKEPCAEIPKQKKQNKKKTIERMITRVIKKIIEKTRVVETGFKIRIR